MSKLDDFRQNLHESSKHMSTGVATVLRHDVPAILVRNVYGQEIVWGMFGCNRGKFKGTLSNNAATEGVKYVASE